MWVGRRNPPGAGKKTLKPHNSEIFNGDDQNLVLFGIVHKWGGLWRWCQSLHWLPCKNQFYPTSQTQLGPPHICKFHILLLSHWFLCISNDICEFANLLHASIHSEKTPATWWWLERCGKEEGLCSGGSKSSLSAYSNAAQSEEVALDCWINWVLSFTYNRWILVIKSLCWILVTAHCGLGHWEVCLSWLSALLKKYSRSPDHQ